MVHSAVDFIENKRKLPAMTNKQPDFVPNQIFHVYNHANGAENIYTKEENYRFFLEKMGDYLPQVVDTLSYCLLPNHFHLLLQVKPIAELDLFYQQKFDLTDEGLRKKMAYKPIDYNYLVRKQITNFLGSYVKSFNKYSDRKGSLLRQNTNRKLVADKDYFLNVIHYLHYNAVHHGIVKDFLDWPHSSYHSLVSKRPTKLAREKILDWFGGRTAFLDFHGHKPSKEYGFEKLLECDF